ncbi:hypothetical protein FCL53_10690 [Elizabethkingia meningoseptica]|uniref:hypothetical protein n=1 Tax=Elizabethkingia meningoseptica TaxID=238 RepID=UPI001365C2B9|nr:hypothetical protein [Elizabethkingia meningoseptica]MVW92431.1 hypothetical protein [Elizabethkingia meningoseptica]
MKTFTTSLGQEFSICYACYKISEYEHYKILVEVVAEGIREAGIFRYVTTNSIGIDEISELSGRERWEALFGMVADKIDNEICEWINTNNLKNKIWNQAFIKIINEH